MKKILLFVAMFLSFILCGNDSALATSSVKWVDVSKGAYSAPDGWDWPRSVANMLQTLGLQNYLPGNPQDLDTQVQERPYTPLIEGSPEPLVGESPNSSVMDVFIGILLVFLVFIIPSLLVVFLFRKMAKRFHRNRARKAKRERNDWIVPTEASEADQAAQPADKETSTVVGGQPKQRRVFGSMYEWRFPALVGLCVFVLIVLFIRKGNESSMGQMDSIMYRLEKLEVSLLSLDKDIHQLQQSVQESEKSVGSLSERVDRLNSMTFQASNRRSSIDGVARESARKEEVQKDGETRRYYDVRSGDTLYRIAVRNKMSVEEICRINNIDDSLKITVGQRIFLE
jgi:LysM repeat protein